MTLKARLQPVDWALVDKTISDWVKTVLPDVETFWEHQNRSQPCYPYVSLLRSSILNDGGGWDEIRTETDLAVVNQEIEVTANNQKAFTLTVQAHVDDENGKNDPGCDAVFMATKLQSSLSLPSYCDLFSAVGMAVIEELQVQDLSIIINRKYISRAALDVRFRIASVMSERTGYIEKAQLVKTDDPELDFTVDAS